MAWSDEITVSNIRNLAGILEACDDSLLDTYIKAIVADIESLTGLDFNFPSGIQTVTFRNTIFKNEFVLHGSILQTGAWQTITLVEKSAIQSNPTWSTLTLYDDYTTETTAGIEAEAITKLFFICATVKKLEQIRITGTLGLSPSIPADLLSIIIEMVKAYAQRLENGQGAYDIQSERSLTRSVTYKENELSSTKIFTPTRIADFLTIINKYNVKNNYPF